MTLVVVSSVVILAFAELLLHRPLACTSVGGVVVCCHGEAADCEEGESGHSYFGIEHHGDNLFQARGGVKQSREIAYFRFNQG